MPQLSNVVLTDRASTPVDHTFVPRSIEAGVATVTETSGVPVGNKKLSISIRQTTVEKRYVVDMKFAVPVVVTETINGVDRPAVVRTAYVDATFKFDSTSTLQERKDAVGMFASALASGQTMINDVLTNLNAIY